MTSWTVVSTFTAASIPVSLARRSPFHAARVLDFDEAVDGLEDGAVVFHRLPVVGVDDDAAVADGDVPGVEDGLDSLLQVVEAAEFSVQAFELEGEDGFRGLADDFLHRAFDGGLGLAFVCEVEFVGDLLVGAALGAEAGGLGVAFDGVRVALESAVAGVA